MVHTIYTRSVSLTASPPFYDDDVAKRRTVDFDANVGRTYHTTVTNWDPVTKCRTLMTLQLSS